jgi:hypothetical protein
MIGRYVEADPMGIKKGENHLYVYVDSVGKPPKETNRYQYAGDNPVNWIDPLGLWYVPPPGFRDIPKCVKQCLEECEPKREMIPIPCTDWGWSGPSHTICSIGCVLKCVTPYPYPLK